MVSVLPKEAEGARQHTDRTVLSSVIAFTKANASEVADLILSTLPSSNLRMEALS